MLEPDLVDIGDNVVVEFEVSFNTSEVSQGLLELRRVSKLNLYYCFITRFLCDLHSLFIRTTSDQSWTKCQARNTISIAGRGKCS